MQEEFVDQPMVDENVPPTSGGFMKFYGLYWKKEFIFPRQQTLPGLPAGWQGQGRKAHNLDKNTMWMNFWTQKGVYVLYDKDLQPVYTGQAGLIKGSKSSHKNLDAGRTLGDRLNNHINGKYRNGWEYFSWFGFLTSEKEHLLKRKIRSASELDRRDPQWSFKPYTQSAQYNPDEELNLLLDSFEAILIEAFTPKFNSRGGNLKDAVYVDQFEETPRFILDI